MWLKQDLCGGSCAAVSGSSPVCVLLHAQLLRAPHRKPARLTQNPPQHFLWLKTVHPAFCVVPQVEPLSAPPPQLVRRTRSSSSDSSSSSSSSESEAESSVAARLSRRLAYQQHLMHQQLEQEQQPAAVTGSSNIVPAPAGVGHSPAAAATTAAPTVVRVCTGKKCAANGSAAVLTQLASVPGVVAQPTKCLKQCRHCVAAEMATAGPGGGCAALYTGLNAANAAGVLAMHRQRQTAQPRV